MASEDANGVAAQVALRVAAMSALPEPTRVGLYGLLQVVMRYRFTTCINP